MTHLRFPLLAGLLLVWGAAPAAGFEKKQTHGPVTVTLRLDKTKVALSDDRITLTPPVLNNAAQVIFMVHGEEKAPALKAVLEGPYEPDQLPAQMINPKEGKVLWLVDPAAAGMLAPQAKRAV